MKYVIFLIFLISYSYAQWDSGYSSSNASNLKSGGTIGHPSGGDTSRVKDHLKLTGAFVSEDTTGYPLSIMDMSDDFGLAGAYGLRIPAGGFLYFTNSNNTSQIARISSAGMFFPSDFDIKDNTNIRWTNFRLKYNSGTSNLEITDASNTFLSIADNGANATFTFTGGLVVGSPTGGDKGSGTINATAVYDDNTLLTDYVFEEGYKVISIEKVEKFYKGKKHLPWIDGRQEWEKNGSPPLGKLVSQLWEAIENQQIYISQLNKRIKKLEKTKRD